MRGVFAPHRGRTEAVEPPDAAFLLAVKERNRSLSAFQRLAPSRCSGSARGWQFPVPAGPAIHFSRTHVAPRENSSLISNLNRQLLHWLSIFGYQSSCRRSRRTGAQSEPFTPGWPPHRAHQCLHPLEFRGRTTASACRHEALRGPPAGCGRFLSATGCYRRPAYIAPGEGTPSLAEGALPHRLAFQPGPEQCGPGSR